MAAKKAVLKAAGVVASAAEGAGHTWHGGGGGSHLTWRGGGVAGERESQVLVLRRRRAGMRMNKCNSCMVCAKKLRCLLILRICCQRLY